jgi:hypothetical protein
MKRRKLLFGASGLAASGATVLGTGAFTSVEAERSVSVTTADDDRAFLRLEPLVNNGLNGDSTRRSTSDGEVVVFDIPGIGDGENSDAQGVGIDSIYEFHDLLTVINQGTQPVQLYSTYAGTELTNLALVSDDGILRNDPPILDVGDSVDVGFLIDTHGSSVGKFDETLTIVANQPDE